MLPEEQLSGRRGDAGRNVAMAARGCTAGPGAKEEERTEKMSARLEKLKAQVADRNGSRLTIGSLMSSEFWPFWIIQMPDNLLMRCRQANLCDNRERAEGSAAARKALQMWIRVKRQQLGGGGGVGGLPAPA